MKTATILIPRDEVREMQNILSGGKLDEQTAPDGVIKTYTAKFGGGWEVDIKVCNAETEGGGPYIDAVLFHDGSEVMTLDVSEDLLGEYKFESGPLARTCFLVKVKRKEDDIPGKPLSKKEVLKHLESLISSCEEGEDGRWDCSTDEGKEGFDAMRDSLLQVLKYVRGK
jgi:hypothetical protein